MEIVSFRTALVLSCLTCGMVPAAAAGLECPKLADLDKPPVAVEVDRLGEKGLLLQQPGELEAAAMFLREQGLSTDDAVNHLIAFYCPAVAAETGLSDDEKAERVRQFSAQATSLVLAQSNVEDVVFNVPLDPRTAEIAAERAKQAGVSVEQWIARTVGAALR